MLYHPEMGEKPEARLFGSSHNFSSSYSLSWAADRDEEARAKMRELRIRAAFGTEPTIGQPGEWSSATRLGKPVFHCLITSKAHRKLMDSDITACETLLD